MSFSDLFDTHRLRQLWILWRARLYVIIFEAETHAGRRFDQWLIWAVLLSVVVVVADSVDALHQRHALLFDILEWGFTIVFTIEYILRLLIARKPLRYVFSFYGIVDLLSVIPTYLALLFPGVHALIDVRILRLLRIFRIFQLGEYHSIFNELGTAFYATRRRITVFIAMVFLVVLIIGTLMYLIEGKENGFTSIPTAMYWAITTITTVGYGDISPQTDLGRFVSSAMMLVGWGTLAVSSGILGAEISSQVRDSREQQGDDMHYRVSTRTCAECLTEGHKPRAEYCFHCGAKLPRFRSDPELVETLKGGTRTKSRPETGLPSADGQPPSDELSQMD